MRGRCAKALAINRERVARRFAKAREISGLEGSQSRRERPRR